LSIWPCSCSCPSTFSYHSNHSLYKLSNIVEDLTFGKNWVERRYHWNDQVDITCPILFWEFLPAEYSSFIDFQWRYHQLSAVITASNLWRISHKFLSSPFIF
jgi:hypothetical protein